MFVDKNGKMISNVGTPALEFSSEADYNDWKANLPEGAKEEDFIVILNYTPEVGSYCQVDTKDELNNLPEKMRRAGVLYGVTEEKKLYYYDVGEDDFIPYSIS